MHIACLIPNEEMQLGLLFAAQGEGAAVLLFSESTGLLTCSGYWIKSPGGMQFQIAVRWTLLIWKGAVKWKPVPEKAVYVLAKCVEREAGTEQRDPRLSEIFGY